MKKSPDNFANLSIKEESLLRIAVAIADGEHETFNEILKEGLVKASDTAKLGEIELPLLAFALQYNRHEIALQLLKLGAKADAKMKINGGERGILSLCTFNTDTRVFSEMLKRGVDLNEMLEPSLNGDQAYLTIPVRMWHLFCLAGNREVVKIFIQEQGDKLLLDAGKFSIVDLLEPKKNHSVKKAYKDCLKKLNDVLKKPKNEQLKSTLLIYKAIKEIEQERKEKGEEKNEPDILMTALNNLVDKGKLSEDFSFKFLMMVALGNLDHKTFIEKLKGPAESIIKFEQLFNGGSEEHQKICQMIKQMNIELNTHQSQTKVNITQIQPHAQIQSQIQTQTQSKTPSYQIFQSSHQLQTQLNQLNQPHQTLLKTPQPKKTKSHCFSIFNVFNKKKAQQEVCNPPATNHPRNI